MSEIDPNHSTTVESNPCRVTVTLNGSIIASMHLTCTLREASYPPVQHIPRDDMQMNLLECTQYHIRCLYKSDVSYYTIVAGDMCADNAVWTCEQPKPVAREAVGYLAFYPNKVATQRE